MHVHTIPLHKHSRERGEGNFQHQGARGCQMGPIFTTRLNAIGILYCGNKNTSNEKPASITNFQKIPTCMILHWGPRELFSLFLS